MLCVWSRKQFPASKVRTDVGPQQRADIYREAQGDNRSPHTGRVRTSQPARPQPGEEAANRGLGGGRGFCCSRVGGVDVVVLVGGKVLEGAGQGWDGGAGTSKTVGV